MEGLLDLLAAPFRLFLRVPVLAFVPGAVFLAGALLPRSSAPRFVFWSGVVWLLYATWETGVWFWARAQGDAGGAPIRADLILIAPILWILTLIAIFLWVRSARG